MSEEVLDVHANYTEDEQVAKSPAKVPLLAPNYELAGLKLP